MILKLEFYGVQGSILNWIKSYLHNRKQRVVLQFVSSSNLLSEGEIVRHGVSQGSVLGPLLFSVCINDSPCIINKVSDTILFADDILVSSSDLNELNSKKEQLGLRRDWVQGFLVDRVSKNWICLEFLVYIFMP